MVKKPVEETFPYNKIGSWCNGDPFAIAFIYPKSKEKALHVFKGSWKTILQKIVEEYKLRPCLVYGYFYCRGQRRMVARVLYDEVNSNYSIYLSKSAIRGHKLGFYKKHWQLSIFRKGAEQVFEKRFRRPPRNWLKELDQYI
jgi:hypothetical protein